MRISDWSSDVCSSDLADLAFHETILRGSRNQFLMHLVPLVANALRLSFDLSVTSMETARGALPRSEEHTSELQSLMRISYAVFCLKKKNIRRITRANLDSDRSHELQK